MRIVSVTCSNTEIVCALGCAHLLVGLDDDSDYPPEVVDVLPRVGRDLDVDAGRIAELEPDLVLASLTVPGHEAVVRRLTEAGLNVFAPEPIGLDDVYQDVLAIGQRLGVDAAARDLVAEMRADIRGVSVDRSATRPSILIQWWPKPVIAPGARSWAHDLIESVGGRNPLAGEAVKSRPLEDAEVVELAPDAIVVAWCGVPFEKYRLDVVEQNPAFAEVPAVRDRRVVAIPEYCLGRPGPRLIEGARALADVVRQCSARGQP